MAKKQLGLQMIEAQVEGFLLFPKFCHVLKSLALGFRDKFPYEDGSNYTNDAIKPIGEPVSEIISLCEVHVEHWHECGTDNEI